MGCRIGMKIVFVEIPTYMHDQLKESAKKNEVDISKLVRHLIQQHLYREHHE